MASQLQEFAESALFKLLRPAMFAVLGTLGAWELNRVNEHLDRIDAFFATAQADKATTELRVRELEVLKTEYAAAIKALQDKALLLEFRVQDIEGRDARSGKKMP